VSEYFDFRLYKDDLSWRDKCAFGGWRAQKILEEILVDDYSRFLSLDKSTMYALLRGYGLPIPEVRAVYARQSPPGINRIAGPEALFDFLRAPDNLPVYVKPAFGSYGRGNALIVSMHQGELTLGDGSRVALSDFCAVLEKGHSLGWIFQEPIFPHPEIDSLCGSKVSGIRVHTFLAASGPKVCKAIFKINVGTEDSDNFRHGASGNMLGCIDTSTGVITRVVSGTGAQQTIDSVHPVTGEQLVGFRVPFWLETSELLCRASQALPGFICPGWDVAICATGPTILEVNAFGDIDLSQHAHRTGFIDEQFMALMEGRALATLMSGPRKRRAKSPLNGRIGARKHHWLW
jgi:hypothetical protein